MIQEFFDGRRYREFEKHEAIKDWWLERQDDGEVWRIEVRNEGTFAVAFTRPVTVEWRIR